MEYCEVCGRSDNGNDVDLNWYEYDENEVVLCSECAEELGAEEL